MQSIAHLEIEDEVLQSIPGAVPSIQDMPSGCWYQARCPLDARFFVGRGARGCDLCYSGYCYRRRRRLNRRQSITALTSQSWLWIPPGLVIIVSVLSINFIGDGIRDAMDPKKIECVGHRPDAKSDANW